MSAPSCPFYGVALHVNQHDFRVLIPSGGNQCALITSAHSPCWMEVAEDRAPDWAQCPRNPEFVALNIFETLYEDVVTARQADVRMLASVRDLALRMRISAAAFPPKAGA